MGGVSNLISLELSPNRPFCCHLISPSMVEIQALRSRREGFQSPDIVWHSAVSSTDATHCLKETRRKRLQCNETCKTCNWGWQKSKNFRIFLEINAKIKIKLLQSVVLKHKAPARKLRGNSTWSLPLGPRFGVYSLYSTMAQQAVPGKILLFFCILHTCTTVAFTFVNVL